MRLAAASGIVALLASGCLGSLEPFCEDQGAYGSWQQGTVYAALRDKTELAGVPVRYSGASGPTLPFPDASYQATVQGEGWLERVSWWSAERRYWMRPLEDASADANGTRQQRVRLEVDRAYMPGFDADEANHFLAATTVLDADVRRALVDQWMNSTPEEPNRLKATEASVALDLPVSYAVLPAPGGFPTWFTIPEGPLAGDWRFAFDHGAASWSGKPTALKISLGAAADGTVSVYYSSAERSPDSKRGFEAGVRRDFAALALPPPTFSGLVHHGPQTCLFG